MMLIEEQAIVHLARDKAKRDHAWIDRAHELADLLLAAKRPATARRLEDEAEIATPAGGAAATPTADSDR